jgi:cellobiose-specific phosphotransferase system component IIC
MADLLKDFWLRVTGTGQQVAQLHDRYMMTMIMMLIGSFFLMLSNNLRISAGLKEGRRWSGMSHTLWILIFNIKRT